MPKARTTGALWKKFFNDDEVWKHGDIYIESEDATFTVNGQEVEIMPDDRVNDDDIISVEGGYLASNSDTEWYGHSIDKELRRWLKNQDSDTLIIQVAKAKRDELVKALPGFSARILK